MKRILMLGTVLILAVALAGCGSTGGTAATFITQIFSDPNADGDIAQDPASPGTFTVTSAATTLGVFAGIDPLTAIEYRGFLDFPLGGVGGVPSGATIVSATLDVFINQVSVTAPSTTVPILIDLVSFQPPTLIASDFDRTIRLPLLSRTVNIFTSDVGTFVPIDVTSLMREAQRLNLPDFQVRLLLDFTATDGRIEIDDQPLVAATAPLLTVEYF